MSTSTIITVLVLSSLSILLLYNSLSESKPFLTSPSDYESQFRSWMIKYKKTYQTMEEYHFRLSVFIDRLKHLKNLTAKPNRSSQLSLNKFSDLTHKELKDLYSSGHIHDDTEKPPQEKFYFVSGNELPLSVDWRVLGAVTEIKDQEKCGACWAFSTIVGLEGLYAIQHNKTKNLSTQQLIDCSKAGTNSGCEGGDISYGYQYVKNGGIEILEDYPYAGLDQKCQVNFTKTAFKIKNFTQVPIDDNDQLLMAVSRQPVSICIDDNNLDFYHYSGGIFNEPCGSDLGHCLAIVGYGSENGVDYWIIKNSWGTDWGEQGYGRMIRQSGKGPGICGIAREAIYPIGL